MADSGEAAGDGALRIAAALADPDRIAIVGLLARQELTVDELAIELGLDAAVIGSHLATLGRSSLIATRRDGHRRLLSLQRQALTELAAWCQASLSRPAESKTAALDVPDGIKQFFSGKRLDSFPARHSRKLQVLNVLVGDFEPGISYTEAEVNQILLNRYPDYATLRRAMIDEGLMTRSGGIYRRAD